ncbi:MAG: PaaI family thioesterase [Enterocloster sp.]
MDYKEQIKRANENNAFMIHNGVRAVELSETAARVEMDPEKTSLNSMGGVHAGLMFLMAEAAAGLLVRNDGRTCVTIDSSFRFLRSAGPSESLYAEARVKKGDGPYLSAIPEFMEGIPGSCLQRGILRFSVRRGEAVRRPGGARTGPS